MAPMSPAASNDGMDPARGGRRTTAGGRATAGSAARRLLRLGLERAEPFGQLANLAWNARRFDEALGLLRFGASVEPLNEGAAQAYFNAARLRAKIVVTTGGTLRGDTHVKEG